jgi:hypothetical protein
MLREKLGIAALVAACLVLLGTAPASSPRLREADRAAPRGGLPSPTALTFEENLGQAPRSARFVARSGDVALSFGARGFALARHSSSLRVKFVGATTRKVRGRAPSPGVLNYLIGGDDRSRVEGVRRFERVVYRDVYPGIDAVFYAGKDGPEYDFRVAPHVDPSTIRLAVQAADEMRITRSGDLAIHTPDLSLYQQRPVAYQIADGRRVEIPIRYMLSDGEITFGLADHDEKRPLVIDPVIAFSTFLGGPADDSAPALAVDDHGNSIVSGQTFSPDFPTTSGAMRTERGGETDAYVAKYTRSGKLVFATLLGGGPDAQGGGGNESVRAVELGPEGQIYLTGVTTSEDFPTKNALQPELSNSAGPSHHADGFLTALTEDGSDLVFSTFLGGSRSDDVTGLAVTSNGDAWLAGTTESLDFPTVDPLQEENAGLSDGFISHVSADGGELRYSSYFGGAGYEYMGRTALRNGSLFVSGSAYVLGPAPGDAPFPTTPGAIRRNQVEAQTDVFVARFELAPMRVAYSTLLGGVRGDDYPGGLAVDQDKNAFVTGSTRSNDFPTYRAAQPRHHENGAGADVFISKVNPSGAGFVYSTFFGSTDDDGASDIEIDEGGRAWLVGSTESNAFPQKWSSRPFLRDDTDGFVAGFDRSGHLTHSMFLGGVHPYDGAEEREHLSRIEKHGRDLYVVGQSNGTYPVARAHDPRRQDLDAVITKLRPVRIVDTHPGNVTLNRLSGHVRFSGRVTIGDGFLRCASSRRVVVEFLRGRRWYANGAYRTGSDGRFEFSYPDFADRYRIEMSSVIKQVDGQWHRCTSAYSNQRVHAH